MKKIEDYLLRGTPSYLLPLGAGFVMASSADLRAALGMGVAVIIIALLSSLVISLIRNIVPQKGHLPIYILIVTGFTSIVQMFMQAWFPEVVNMLGVHLAALSVSAVLYRDAEEVAGINGVGKSVLTALLTGVFFTVVMVVCALFREVLGNGSIWGVEIGFLKDYKIASLAGAFGAYLVLAIVLAVIRAIGSAINKKQEVKEVK